MKNLCGIPDSIKEEEAKSSLLGSQKPRRQLASWLNLLEVGCMVYAALSIQIKYQEGIILQLFNKQTWALLKLFAE